MKERRPRLVILVLGIMAAVANCVVAMRNNLKPEWFWIGVHGVLGLVSGVVIGRYLVQRLIETKEEEPSSPNQQPTSGTSQNRNPYAYLSITGMTITGPKSQIGSQPPSESQFQPKPRAVPVVGFRSWHIESRHRVGIGPGWRLASYNRQYGNWEPGQNKATCQRRGLYYGLSPASWPLPHHVPDAECSCGFYVLTDFDKVPFVIEETLMGSQGEVLQRRPVTMMVGAVVGWGRVIQHGDEGWRAEKVQVIALLDCKVSPDHLRITNEVAESYGVPVLSRSALELLAKEYGDRLVGVEPSAGPPALAAHNEV